MTIDFTIVFKHRHVTPKQIERFITDDERFNSLSHTTKTRLLNFALGV